jgi:DNA-binding MarR family transcriptional regulator
VPQLQLLKQPRTSVGQRKLDGEPEVEAGLASVDLVDVGIAHVGIAKPGKSALHFGQVMLASDEIDDDAGVIPEALLVVPHPVGGTPDKAALTLQLDHRAERDRPGRVAELERPVDVEADQERSWPRGRRYGGRVATTSGASLRFAEELVNAIDGLSSLAQVDMLRSGVTLAQARVLAALRSQGPQRITDLAAFEYVSQPAMSSQITSLERIGLVRRTASPEDGRVVLVELTTKGEAVILSLRASRSGALVRHLEGLSAQDRLDLGAFIGALEDLAQLMRSGQAGRRQGGASILR